jgi:hypothetical protein
VKTIDALVLAGSLLVSLVGAELVVRHLDGLPLFAVPIPEGEGLIEDVPKEVRDQIALAPGVSRDWFHDDPPPLPNRSEPPAEWTRLFWEVKNNPEAYRPFAEVDAFRAWNSVFVGDPCKNDFLRRAPEHRLYVYDPANGKPRPPYRYMPNATTPIRLVTNQIGWRGPPIEVPRSGRTVRIVFVGASTVVGNHFLPYSYPEYIGHWLNEWAASKKLAVRFEALNAGRESTTSTDIAEEVRTEVLPLRPDLVVYYEGGNQFDMRTVVPGVPAGKPQQPKATTETGPAWLVELSRYSALSRRVQAALGYAGAGLDGREWPKPDYKIVWPADLSETDPDLGYPKLPLNLNVIERDLDQIRSDLSTTGTEFAVSSFYWLVRDSMVLNPVRNKYILEQLNVALYPFRYRDIERMANFQNRFLAKYAAQHDLAFIDTASRMPFAPDLFTDAVHGRAGGLRLQAWVVLQQLIPLVERHLAKGDWPRPVPNDMPPLPTFQPRRISFDCKAP